jgi:UDP-N-acetyl-D-glucosamine dehydrogenase
MIDDLVANVERRDACIGVVGLGYVGLPIVIEFAKVGFKVLGLDIDTRKTDALNAGESYIRHIPSSEVREQLADNPRADSTTDFARIGECDAVLICVPTPLNEHREPDLSYIRATAELISPHLRSSQLVTLESTTYPGTTEEVLVPLLEAGSGLKAGENLYVAYSPEREDPNNKQFSTSTIPKVVGGLDADSLRLAQAVYDAIICETIPVSNCRTAEATKLMENIFRCVNIALVNELKVVFSEMDINIWEVVNAAKTKPFGYMPFYPGPGLGGHCIPIDPFYLTWKAKEYGISTKFIELAGEINTSMPNYVIQQTMLALNELSKSLRGSRVLLVGLAYKKNVDDVRESPTFTLWEELVKRGAEVDYYDPYCAEVVPTREHPQFAGIKSRTLDEIAAGGYDVALILTAHDNVDHDALAEHVSIVVDARNACSDLDNVRRA